MQAENPTACLIVIGNEILSGRTQDKNIAWLGQQLNDSGIRLMEVRVIPDIQQTIVEAVNTCRKRFTYVFTTGGIGPTHDDITAESVAKAFGLPVERNAEAMAILEKHYGDTINEARMSMADMPQGARLIQNPVSAAPGFIIENLYVMAGVPSIMQAMFSSVKHELSGGAKMLSRTLSVFVTEGTLAEGLTNIQNAHPEVEIGSYPFFRNQKLGSSLVMRSTNENALKACQQQLYKFLQSYTQEIFEE